MLCIKRRQGNVNGPKHEGGAHRSPSAVGGIEVKGTRVSKSWLAYMPSSTRARSHGFTIRPAFEIHHMLTQAPSMLYYSGSMQF